MDTPHLAISSLASRSLLEMGLAAAFFMVTIKVNVIQALPSRETLCVPPVRFRPVVRCPETAVASRFPRLGRLMMKSVCLPARALPDISLLRVHLTLEILLIGVSRREKSRERSVLRSAPIGQPPRNSPEFKEIFEKMLRL